MALPALAAVLAKAGPAIAKMFAGGGGAALTKGGSQAAGTLGGGGGGMNMSLLSNAAAYQQGGPSPGTPPSPSPGTGGSGGGMSNFMGNMRGGINDLGFSGLAKGIQENIEKLRAWTDGLHNSNMQFAEFSASMASVQAQSEVREYQLKREQGERRAGSAGFLAEQKGGLDKSLAPIENLWAKFENMVGGGLLAALNVIIKPLSTVAQWLDSATDGKAGDDNLSMMDVFTTLGNMEHEAVMRRPERMR